MANLCAAKSPIAGLPRSLSVGLFEDMDEEAVPRSRGQLLKQLQTDWLGIFLGPVVSVPFATCYTSLICFGTGLDADFAIVLQQVMWTQFLGSVGCLLDGQFVTSLNMDPVQAILLAQMVKQVSSQYTGDPDMFLGHMMIVFSIMAALLGLVLYVVGRWRLGYMMRFLPYTVVGGFLAGMGCLVFLESFRLAIGEELSQLIYDTYPLSKEAVEATQHLWLQVLLTTAYAIVSSYASAVHNFGTPAWMLFVVLCSVFSRYWTGGEFPPSSWYLSYQGNADWSTIFVKIGRGLPTVSSTLSSLDVQFVMSSIAILAISWCFNVLAAEKFIPLKRGVFRCDQQSEIQSLGLINLVVGLVGGHGAFHSFKIPLMIQQIKGGDLWPYFNAVANVLLFVLTPQHVVNTIPLMVFSGTILGLSWQIIVEWLIHSRSRVASIEWNVLCATAFVTVINISVGIFLGMLLTLMLFAVEYSGVTGVTRTGSLDEFRSMVERSNTENFLLRAHGERVRILWLSGYLFFGSASHITDEVRRTVEESSGGALPVKIVVLDFSTVPAMDASGVLALVDLVSELRERKTRLVFCGLVRRLDLAFRNALAKEESQPVFIHDLDSALEWCEGKLLEWLEKKGFHAPSTARSRVALDATGAITLDRDFEEGEFEFIWTQLLSVKLRNDPEEHGKAITLLRQVAKWREVSDGEVIFRVGESAEELFVLASGSIEVTMPADAEQGKLLLPRHHLNTEKGDVYIFEEQRPRRVRRARCGAVFGAIEYAASKQAVGGALLGAAHTCTGTAFGTTTVWALPFEELWRLELEQPVVALVLRTWLSLLAATALRKGVQDVHQKAQLPTMVCPVLASIGRSSSMARHGNL